MSLVNTGLAKFARLIHISSRHLGGKVEVGKSATMSRTIVAADVQHFAEISGDTNPVHSGEAAVVHGAFLNAMVSCVMGTELPGPGSMVVSQSIKYPNPCHVGDTVTVSVAVTGMKADLIKCRYSVMAQSGSEVASSKPVLTGEANLIMSDNQRRRAAKKEQD